MYGKVGVQSLSNGSVGPLRIDERGALVVANEGGRYYEAVKRGNVYIAANQTGCVWTVGLATTYTGLCLTNPLGSGKNLAILGVGHQEVVAPTGIAAVYLAGLYHATAVTQSVASTVLRANIGPTTAAPVGLAATGATLPAAPKILMNLTAGHTSGALSASASPAWTELGGLLVLEPGSFLIVANFTIGVAVGQMASFIWEEIPV
jgi:hypothetical protein